MSSVPVFLSFTLLCAFSFAQVARAGEASLDVSVERARIQSDRDAAESRFSQQEAACYAQFAVTDCLQEVRLRRRQLFDDLRRQTVLLNDLERRKKTLSKLEGIDLKSSAQKVD